MCKHGGLIATVSAALLLFVQYCGAQRIVRYTDVTEEAGVVYDQCGESGEVGVRSGEGATGGAAAGDYDGDGRVDLFVTRICAPPILYKNVEGPGGEPVFSNVTEAAGLSAAQPTGSNGAAWGDIDNDGDLDLYVTATRGANEDLAYGHALYINDSFGNFTEEGEERGASLNSGNPHYGQSVSFGDYDRDGFLDIHVTEWIDPYWNRDNVPSHNRLLRNLGMESPGYFVDVTESAGVSVDHVVGDYPGFEGDFGFTSRFSDLDGDGWPDLAIASDFTESALFWNNGDGTFIDGTVAAGVGLDKNGMGATTADFNGDGHLDWYVTSIWEEGEPEHTGNYMYYNNGDRTFLDGTTQAGVREGFWGWGATALDFDNDGDQDLIEVNGYYHEDDVDFNGKWARTPTRFWRNVGGGVFEGDAPGLGLADDHSSRGVLTFDYDDDGDLEIFVVNHAGQPVLYRNDGGNTKAWLRIKTEGTLSNKDGIGALITVIPDLSSPDSFQVHEVSGSSNFLSQNEMTVHVGLGVHDGPVDLVEIRWPSGVIERIEGVSANTVIEAVEPSCSGLLVAGSAKRVDRGTIFQDATYCGFELTGASATLSALSGVTTRISFLDPDGDLCFADFRSDNPEARLTIELSGLQTGILSPYSQLETTYVRGLASFSIANSDETTAIRIFSLGNNPDRVDPALILNTTFSGNVDGIADVRAVTVSASGEGTTLIRSIDAANANFTGMSGITGIRAEAVRVSERLALYDLTPLGTAQPHLRVDPESSIEAILITGGDLAEAVGDYRIDTGGVSYTFPVRAIGGQRSIGDSPLRPDLGNGLLPSVKDTFVESPATYFLNHRLVE